MKTPWLWHPALFFSSIAPELHYLFETARGNHFRIHKTDKHLPWEHGNSYEVAVKSNTYFLPFKLDNSDFLV